jgi:hypothetical protein
MGMAGRHRRGTMPGFDQDIFWKLAAWTLATYAGAVTAALALGIEPSLLG